MWVRRLNDCPEIVAGDATLLRELLNPRHDDVEARYSLAVARLGPGKRSTPHALQTTEVYTLLQGRGVMTINGESRDIAAGDAVYIPPRATQSLANTGDEEIVFLCIVDPAWRAEDEIVFPASEPVP